MPATLLYEPIAPPQKAGGAGDIGEAFKQLRETFGQAPMRYCVEIGPNHVFTLRSLGAFGTVFEQLANIVEKQGRVRVWIQE